MAGAPFGGCPGRYRSIENVSSSSQLCSSMLLANMEPQNSCKSEFVDLGLVVPIGKDAVTPEPSLAKLDPFGDESDVALKYRTMTWR